MQRMRIMKPLIRVYKQLSHFYLRHLRKFFSLTLYLYLNSQIITCVVSSDAESFIEFKTPIRFYMASNFYTILGTMVPILYDM